MLARLKTAASVLDTVEEAYKTNVSDAEWVQAVIARLAPQLNVGLGVFGWLYDASALPNIKAFHPTTIGVADGVLEAIFATAGHPEMSPELLAHHYATPAGCISEQIGAAYPEFRPWKDHLYPLGIRDILTINALDVDGWGCAINVLLPERGELQPTELATFERLSSHLIASYRLRRRQLASEATLTLSGSVVHLEGEAAQSEHRDALQEAARLLERARGQLRNTSPEESLAIWRALVSGRWSLVDFVDTDGKRFLVARVNEPAAHSPSPLTRRERQIAALVRLGHSNKLIAYDLGLTESTVASHVANAMKKLGLQARAELARVMLQSDEAGEATG